MTACKEAEPSVCLTISFGDWGEDHIEQHWWIFIEARPTVDSYEMMVREPEESAYFGEKFLGKGLSRNEVLTSADKDDFFAVADCIAFNDLDVKSYLLDVKSYLLGMAVNLEGRNTTN